MLSTILTRLIGENEEGYLISSSDIPDHIWREIKPTSEDAEQPVETMVTEMTPSGSSQNNGKTIEKTKNDN